MAEGSDLALLIRTLHPLLGSLLLVQREMRWQGAAGAIRKPHIATTGMVMPERSIHRRA